MSVTYHLRCPECGYRGEYPVRFDVPCPRCRVEMVVYGLTEGDTWPERVA